MTVDPGLLSFAFLAGVWAFFNPCGVGMLPAYVAYYLGGLDEGEAELPWWRRGLKGLLLGLVLSAGFFSIIASLGLLFAAIGRGIAITFALYLPWVGGVIGLLLIGLGALTLWKGYLPLYIPLPRLRVPLTAGAQGGNPHPRAGSGHRLLSIYLYGIGYGLGSVACTSPVFLIVATPLLVGQWLEGASMFLIYTAAATLLLLALALAVALAGEVLRQYLPRTIGIVARTSGLLLIAGGLFMIWYNLIKNPVLFTLFR